MNKPLPIIAVVLMLAACGQRQEIATTTDSTPATEAFDTNQSQELLPEDYREDIHKFESTKVEYQDGIEIASAFTEYDISSKEYNQHLRELNLPFTFRYHYSEKNGYKETLYYQGKTLVCELTAPNYLMSVSRVKHAEFEYYRITIGEDCVGCSYILLLVPGEGIYRSANFDCDSDPYTFEESSYSPQEKSIMIFYGGSNPDINGQHETITTQLVKPLP